jgi:hypothetical protein
MTTYWLAGAAIGQRMGYFELLWSVLTRATPERGPAGLSVLAINVVVTVWAQVHYYRSALAAGTAVCHAGRPLSWFSLLAIPFFNGIFETFHFFSWFDWGIQLLAPSSASETVKFLLGFSTFTVGSGISHALMWGGFVFPSPHIPADPMMIVRLTIMSACWLWTYRENGDVLPVFVLHIFCDIMIVLSLHISPPWAKKNPAKAHAT